ncbi:MAG TPA: hydroxymethylglutaryl-CoA lyase [Kofleriaceae bacterium]|nr:hydroxymethylglutaryl-CoA lyase [Kofleriaceae bacterium]
MQLPTHVTIYEVGPRDGLQNEARQVPTADKIRFIDSLVDAGIRDIEITSFVSPKWIPQLADASEVSRGVRRRDGVRMSALVPNRRGLETALASGMKEVAVFMSASETHNKKNVNKTIAETLTAFEDVIPHARKANVPVRAYLSTCFGCPYEGDVDPERVVALTGQLRDMGVYQVSVSDTIGVANPKQTEDVLARVLAKHPVEAIAVHFHDTQGTALANCFVALTLGITTIDAAAGGLGGCPYAPGASGNLATEDVVAMLHGMGIHTGVDLDKLTEASRTAGTFVGHELPSKYLKAHLGKQARARRRAELGR